MPQATSEKTQPRSGRRPVWMAVVAALVTAAAIGGLWWQEHNKPGIDRSPSAPNGLFLASQAEGTTLASVGRTLGLTQPCTAWLLDTGGPAQSDAYAVTAAPCVGVTDAATVVTEQPVTGATIDFHAFAPVSTAKLPELVTAPVAEVAWASARWTNLAILRLGSSIADLTAQGIEPITALPAQGADTKVLVAGVPVAGIAEGEQFVRGATCLLGGTSQLLEAPWLWREIQSSDCPGTLGGSAGSPILNEAGQALGMVVASSVGAAAGPDCRAGRPCEVADGQVEPAKMDTSYVVAVDAITACFPDGAFALGADCTLEDPTGVAPATAEPSIAPPGTTVPVRLDTRLAAPDLVADITGPLATLDCTDGSGWSDPVSFRAWQLDVTLPDAEGWTLACVGSPEQPTPVVIEAAPAQAGGVSSPTPSAP